MSTSREEQERSQLAEAIEELVTRRQRLTALLDTRARSVVERPRRGRTWAETKREILGHVT